MSDFRELQEFEKSFEPKCACGQPATREVRYQSCEVLCCDDDRCGQLAAETAKRLCDNQPAA